MIMYVLMKFQIYNKYMEPQKIHFKPNLSSKNKIAESKQEIISKINIYFKYRLGALYRVLKQPIYDTLITGDKRIKGVGKKIQPNITWEEAIQLAYKLINLNSKYHHRQKMRLSRTPLLKYIKYDFAALRDKLNSKQFKEQYDDLEDDYDDDEPTQKKVFEKDPKFQQRLIINYKKKHQVTGGIIIAKGYQDLKERLVQRYRWHQNPDETSLIYDLKFMSKKKDIDTVNLLDNQIINHFQQNKSITTKFGLCRNIRNLVNLGGNPHQFFPKCFDVNDVTELQDFYEQFKLGAVIRILKDVRKRKNKIFPNQKIPIEIAIYVLQKILLPIEQKIHFIVAGKHIYITQDQYLSIEKYWSETKEEQISLKQDLYDKVMKILQELKKYDYQQGLNQDNIWIVKPASMSRGRGIKTFNDLTQILDYIAGNQISWVVQKYIEKPLIIKKRKFDIRQWILITDWKPLRVWVYEECYVRFCAQLYNPEDLKNRKVHLTNNSVTKGLTNIPEKDGIQQNMMTQEQFSKYLESISNKQVFHSIIKPQIIKIAIDTLNSVKDNIVPRKNTLQLFGYDFMIDEQYRVWLIQINSSPTMEYSTKITQKLVKKGMSDLGDVIVQYMMNGKIYKGPQYYGGWKLVS